MGTQRALKISVVSEYLVDIKRLQSADVPLTKVEQVFTNEPITWDAQQRRRRQWLVQGCLTSR